MFPGRQARRRLGGRAFFSDKTFCVAVSEGTIREEEVLTKKIRGKFVSTLLHTCGGWDTICARSGVACAYPADTAELSKCPNRVPQSTGQILCIWINLNLNRLCNIDYKRSNECAMTPQFSFLNRSMLFEFYEHRVFIFIFHQFSKISGAGNLCPKHSLNTTFSFIHTRTSSVHIALRSHLTSIFLVFFSLQFL